MDKGRMGKGEVGSDGGSAVCLRALTTTPGVHLIQMILLFIDRGRVLKCYPPHTPFQILCN